MRPFWRKRPDDRPPVQFQMLGGRDRDGNARRTLLIALAGLFLTAVGSIAAVIAILPESNDPDKTAAVASTGASTLSIEEAVVRNGPAAFAMTDGVDRQTAASSPTIDLTVFNRGTHRALVTGAQIEILDWAELPICYAQGGGPVPSSARYTIPMPTSPPGPGGRTIKRALHQQIPADDVDRFLLRFAPDASVSNADQLVVLRLRLTIDGGATLYAGKFLISLPAQMYGGAERFPIADGMAGEQRKEWLGLTPTWCYRQNLEVANRLLNSDAKRAQELSGIGRLVPSTGWTRDHDRTPARAAAVHLLDAYSPPHVRLAIYAAEQTGDRAFVKQTTAAAAQRILDMAKEALDVNDPDIAARDARASLALRDTPEARALLAQAQARPRKDNDPTG